LPKHLSVTLEIDGDGPAGAARCLIAPSCVPRFVAKSGWGDAHESLLAGDASFRKYFRPQARERHPPWSWTRPRRTNPWDPSCTSAGHLLSLGLSAPENSWPKISLTASCCSKTWATTRSRASSKKAATKASSMPRATDVLVALHRAPDHARLPGLGGYNRRGADRCRDAAAGMVPARGERQNRRRLKIR